MGRDVRALVALNVALIAAFGLVALLDPPAKGWGVLACAVAYNVALPLTARAVGRPTHSTKTMTSESRPPKQRK